MWIEIYFHYNRTVNCNWISLADNNELLKHDWIEIFKKLSSLNTSSSLDGITRVTFEYDKWYLWFTYMFNVHLQTLIWVVPAGIFFSHRIYSVKGIVLFVELFNVCQSNSYIKKMIIPHFSILCLHSFLQTCLCFFHFSLLLRKFLYVVCPLQF